ncbi:MAG: grasp-with-spasm system ATP-grasp peptide maturase [Paludibacter sp.]|nr:grasp-with-spasm system ATP-grasp peptide maturase [Paludibacter sp.]
MILIFTIKFDYSSTCVIRWLNHYGVKVVRINGDDNTYQFDAINSKGIFFRNTLTDELINLREATACWWRRTGITHNQLNDKTFQIDRNRLVSTNEFLLSHIKGHVNEEMLALKDYIFEILYNTIPINLGKPLFDLNRLIILDLADKYELKVPQFEIIKDGKQLIESQKKIGNVVTKAISNGIYSDYQGKRYYTYTELLENEFYESNHQNTFSPSLISELVEKKYEIRSFYIEGKFYSMAIFSQSNEKTRIDFRKYANNKNVPYQLPLEIEEKLIRLFKKLDLNCGSVDLIVDKQDNFIFLEINPVGQFGMTSEPCNYNLEKIVANYLRNGRIRTN